MRGRNATLGQERVSANGYCYVKTPQGWILKHKLIAEKKLGRALKETERVRYADGDRQNFDPDNIIVYEARKQSKARRIAALQAKIEELQAEIHHLQEDE